MSLPPEGRPPQQPPGQAYPQPGYPQQPYPPQPYPQQPYQAQQPFPRQPYQPQPYQAQQPSSPRPGIVHGSAGDPRYPSPRGLRRTFGFTVDLLLHLGCAVGVFFAAKHVSSLSHLPTVWAILAWFVVSFVHRALIQRGTQASLGKALFGLRLVRPLDGGDVGFGTLAKAWLVSIWATILTVGSIAGSGNGDVDEDSFILPVVRRRDVRALRGR